MQWPQCSGFVQITPVGLLWFSQQPLLFFKNIWFYVYMCIPECRYLYYMCARICGDQKSPWITWNWSYKCLETAMWVLGNEPGPLARAARALSCWAISTAQLLSAASQVKKSQSHRVQLRELANLLGLHFLLKSGWLSHNPPLAHLPRFR